MGVTIAPHEADAIGVVDPDAVLASPVAAQGLQTVARENAKVIQSMRAVQLPEFALRDAGNLLADVVEGVKFEDGIKKLAA